MRVTLVDLSASSTCKTFMALNGTLLITRWGFRRFRVPELSKLYVGNVDYY